MIRPLCLLMLVLSLMLSGCQPSLAVSTDPADTDFSPFQSAVISSDRFSIQADVRVFTLYAFLNGVAGYDLENAETSSPARLDLRADVKKKLSEVPPERVRAWQKNYADHKSHPWAYLYYTLTLGTPPAFNYIVPLENIKDQAVVERLHKAGFNKVLAEFYQMADIGALYESKYRAVMTTDAENYSAERIESQLNLTHAYLRIPPEGVNQFDLTIIPAPFDSHYVAYAIGYTDHLYILDGPGSNDRGLNVHEYLHQMLDPVLPSDLAGEKAKFERILKENIEKDYVKGNYEQAQTFVEECLVRALDYRIRLAETPGDPQVQARVEAIMAQEMAGGLALVKNFFNALADFEQNPEQDLKSFVTTMLQAYPEE